MISTASVDNPGLVCKSAHAGSIPASKAPQTHVCGVFYACEKGGMCSAFLEGFRM